MMLWEISLLTSLQTVIALIDWFIAEEVEVNILYVHGFGSSFDPESEKVKALSEVGTVYGVNLDWSQSPSVALEQISDSILENKIDLVVGTSMGGWAAAASGTEHGIPFVSINPAINPSSSLLRHVGHGVDYLGRKYSLSEKTVAEYEPLRTGGCGLILLDLADDVIDARSTINSYSEHYQCVEFHGGSHRFEHMRESLATITEFYSSAEIIYGLDEI